ncbi:hypothetical protein Leryth_008349 [Lithospermum erythrorhizon]|nr:hypothetical protein Leryth_008349 [Lithospermum erythrorhizon]
MGSAFLPPLISLAISVTLLTLFVLPGHVHCATRHYEFNIQMQNVTRLCHTKSIVTVNGKFPGPRIVAREGDNLLIKVANHVTNNITIHWHGIRQLRSGWADGPAYITQCPIQTGQSYVYNYTITDSAERCTGVHVFNNTSMKGSEALSFASLSMKTLPLFRPSLPALNDTAFAAKFTNKLRSLASPQFPANVPQKVDKHFFFTVGLGTNPCDKNQTCQGPNGTKFCPASDQQCIPLFSLPQTALLEAHFSGQSHNIYKPNFPYSPKSWFNFTGTPPNNTLVNNDTRLMVLPFSTRVELVMQDTSILGAESHPLHIHGFNFFVVGQGFGNFDPKNDPKKFNLVDPVERNTVGVPAGGWVAIRFLADNPGVWFMHCHLEVHLSWGLKMAWLVLDGKLPNQRLLPPPADLPKC